MLRLKDHVPFDSLETEHYNPRIKEDE